MTDVDIQKTLFKAFDTINEVCNVSFVNESTVCYPNKDFAIPENNRWFNLWFMPSEPEVIGLLNAEAQNRWTGLFQIDIHTPLGSGEDESDYKYKCIAKVFHRGAVFGDVNINKISKSSMIDGDSYKTVVRIEWDADISPIDEE